MVIVLFTFLSSAVYAEKQFTSLPETPQNRQEESAEISGNLDLTKDGHTVHTAQIDRLNQGVTALLGIVIVLIIFWNRKLNKQLNKRINIEKSFRTAKTDTAAFATHP